MRHAYTVGLSLAAALIVTIAATGPAWGFDGPITEYPIPTGESEPTAIALGPDGAMWFTEAAGDKIGRIDSTGKITEHTLPTADAEPNGIVTGADGNLWFTETHANKIGKLVPSTGAITEYSIPTANSQPTGIALGAEGDVWFTEYATSKVARITPSGTVTEYTTLFGDDNPLYITPSAGEGTSMWYSGDKGHHIGYVNESGLAGETTAPKEQDPTGIATGSDGATWFSTFEAESEASTLDRLPDLFGTITETAQFSLNLGQLLADSDLGFWYVSDTGDGATLYRVTSNGIFTDEARAPTPAHGSDCYSKTNLRACPLDGLAFGPNRAIWFTDFSTNSIGVFPTDYAPLPEVSGPAGPEGKAGPSGATGAEGKAGPSGTTGAEGKAGAAGVNASTTIVIVPFQTTVTASSVTVHYALTAAAKVTLSVTATVSAKTAAKGASRDSARKAGKTTNKGPVIVATSNGKVGSDTITWNRRLSGKLAKSGTYTLTLQASAGTAQAKAAEKVRLSSH